MLRLFVKDNTTGTVHEYGTDRHDALILQEDGSLHYHNLQNGCGTMFPDEGYSFCYEDGTIPDLNHPDVDPCIDIAGEMLTFELDTFALSRCIIPLHSERTIEQKLRIVKEE